MDFLIGVLALQGGVQEHLDMLARLDTQDRKSGGQGILTRRVRKSEDLAGLAALIIPGGESSAVSVLLGDGGLADALRSQIQAGLAVWGTCMGAILLSASIYVDTEAPAATPRVFGLMDMEMKRNAYGCQLDSFTSKISVLVLEGGSFPMVFIRAPRILSVGPSVEILAEVAGSPVACRQGRLLATTFHPELSADLRFHEFFVNMARGLGLEATFAS